MILRSDRRTEKAAYLICHKNFPGRINGFSQLKSGDRISPQSNFDDENFRLIIFQSESSLRLPSETITFNPSRAKFLLSPKLKGS
jgi:diacylglycerol kinase family enzyme